MALRVETKPSVVNPLPADLEADLFTWITSHSQSDPQKWLATLRAMAQMLPDHDQAGQWLPIIAKQASTSVDPERALNNWERFFQISFQHR